MTKSTLTFSVMLLIILINSNVYSQLRVDPSGRIGMGTTNPNPEFKCHIKGNLLLTTYPEIPPPNSVPVELRIKVGNGLPGVDIGTNVDKIAFWSSGVGWNKLYAQSFSVLSDSSAKSNIVRLENGLEKILKLTPYSYNMKEDEDRDQKKVFGLLAQEVEKIVPEAVDHLKGAILIDYMQIIPLLISATTEQSKVIDSLKNEVIKIKEKLDECCAKHSETNLIGSNLSISKSTLSQNKPNPFNEKTEIEFDIVETNSKATILIFDMQGTLKTTIPIFTRGKGKIVVNGSELPAGMYIYSLIIDEIEIDSKRMILIN